MRALAVAALILLLPAASAQITAHTAHTGPLAPDGVDVAWGGAGPCGSPRGGPEAHLAWQDGEVLFDAGPEGACVALAWMVRVPEDARDLEASVTGTRLAGQAGAGGARIVVWQADREVASARLWNGVGPVDTGDVAAQVEPGQELRIAVEMEAGPTKDPVRLSVTLPQVRFTADAPVHIVPLESTASWLGSHLISEEEWRIPVAATSPGLQREVLLEVPATYAVRSVAMDGQPLDTHAVLDARTGTTYVTVQDPGRDGTLLLTTFTNGIPGDTATQLSGLFAVGLVATAASGATAVVGARRVHRLPGIRRGLLWALVAALVAIDIVTILRLADPAIWPLMTQSPLPPAGALAYGGLFVLSLSGVLTVLWAANRAHRHARREADDQREQAAHLLQVNEHLDLFSASVAHDLKGPVAGSVQATRMVLEEEGDNLSERSREALGKVAGSLERIARMVSDLLDLAQAQTPPQSAPVDLQELVGEVEAILQPRLAQLGGTIHTGPLGEVHGDRVRLLRLVHNLVENGLEHRGQEPPQVHISHVRNGDEDMIIVEDNGRGIAPGDQDRIFEPFHRLEHSGGRGLGLAIVRRIVQMHHGSVSLRSSLGRGTQFQVRLPAAPATG